MGAKAVFEACLGVACAKTGGRCACLVPDHLFQGRYKSLIVDPDGGWGPLYHYIHLNPVCARLRPSRPCRTIHGPACGGG
jgi:hypothetical protein